MYTHDSIKGESHNNNFRKFLLESDILASCILMSPYFQATFRKYSNFKGDIPQQLTRKLLSIKNIRTLFPGILVVGYPLTNNIYNIYYSMTKN